MGNKWLEFFKWILQKIINFFQLKWLLEDPVVPKDDVPIKKKKKEK